MVLQERPMKNSESSVEDSLVLDIKQLVITSCLYKRNYPLRIVYPKQGTFKHITFRLAFTAAM